MSSKHLDEIIELITKEETLENEEKIVKAIAKSIGEVQKKPTMDNAEKSAEELSNKEAPEDAEHILETPDPLEAVAKESTDKIKV